MSNKFRRIRSKYIENGLILEKYRYDEVTKTLINNETNMVVGGLEVLESLNEIELEGKVFSAAVTKDISVKIDTHINNSDNTYRKKIDKILKADLNNDVLLHDNLNGMNSNNNFLHISKTERDKFLGYESLITDLTNRIAALEANPPTPPEPPTPPVPETQNVIWQLDFVVGAEYSYCYYNAPNYNPNIHNITMADFYGSKWEETTYAVFPKAVLLFGGFASNPDFSQNRMVPRRDVDHLYLDEHGQRLRPDLFLDGVYTFTDVSLIVDAKKFLFSGGGMTDFAFRLVMYDKEIATPTIYNPG